MESTPPVLRTGATRRIGSVQHVEHCTTKTPLVAHNGNQVNRKIIQQRRLRKGRRALWTDKRGADLRPELSFIYRGFAIAVLGWLRSHRRRWHVRKGQPDKIFEFALVHVTTHRDTLLRAHNTLASVLTLVKFDLGAPCVKNRSTLFQCPILLPYMHSLRRV